jgi:hypothetical protein
MKFSPLFFVLILFGFDGFGATTEEGKSMEPVHLSREEHIKHLKRLMPELDKLKSEEKKIGLIIGRGNKHPLPPFVSPGTTWIYNDTDMNQMDVSDPLFIGVGLNEFPYNMMYRKKVSLKVDEIMTDLETSKFFTSEALLEIIKSHLKPGGTFRTSGSKGWTHQYSDGSPLDHKDGFLRAQAADQEQWKAIVYYTPESSELHISLSHKPRRSIFPPIALPDAPNVILAFSTGGENIKGWAFVELFRQSLDQYKTEFPKVPNPETRVWESVHNHIIPEMLKPLFDHCVVEHAPYPFEGNIASSADYNTLDSSIRCTGFKGNIPY